MMKSKLELFRELHYQNEPLLIANVWNVQSAKCFEKAGYKAVGTSSAAVAESLGYSDGEAMPFDEYLFIAKRIAASTALPLSVDIEGGYAREVPAIVDHIVALANIGVAGINIEDSLVRDGVRSMLGYDEFASLLQSLCRELAARKVEIFINVRSDAFLIGAANPLDESLKRIEAYQGTGVHGLFFPCATALEDIKALARESNLPVNVMCMPTLPAFSDLKSAGVKRISMGNFVNKKLYGELEKLGGSILLTQSFKHLFS